MAAASLVLDYVLTVDVSLAAGGAIAAHRPGSRIYTMTLL